MEGTLLWMGCHVYRRVTGARLLQRDVNQCTDLASRGFEFFLFPNIVHAISNANLGYKTGQAVKSLSRFDFVSHAEIGAVFL